MPRRSDVKNHVTQSLPLTKNYKFPKAKHKKNRELFPIPALLSKHPIC